MTAVMTDRSWVDAMDHRGADLFFNALAQCGNLAERNAVDMFARDGILTVARYFDKVNSLELWELNPDFKKALEEVPRADVTIGDSYETVQSSPSLFDFIVVDSPQGIYPTSIGVVAEHFQFLPLMKDVMAEDCLVVVYVNKSPYVRDAIGNFGRDRYEDHDHVKWMQMRRDFYGDDVITEEQALAAYRRVFAAMDRKIDRFLMTPCWDDHPGLPPSFRLAMWTRG